MSKKKEAPTVMDRIMEFDVRDLGLSLCSYKGYDREFRDMIKYERALFLFLSLHSLRWLTHLHVPFFMTPTPLDSNSSGVISLKTHTHTSLVATGRDNHDDYPYPLGVGFLFADAEAHTCIL